MKYFVDEVKRKASHSTCYFEFQKGYYHDACWLKDSISLSDTMWDEYHLSDLLGAVIKEFDYYGITTITKEQWDEIVKLSLESKQSEPVRNEIITEAAPWVNECLKEYDVFTILGM